MSKLAITFGAQGISVGEYENSFDASGFTETANVFLYDPNGNTEATNENTITANPTTETANLTTETAKAIQESASRYSLNAREVPQLLQEIPYAAVGNP